MFIERRPKPGDIVCYWTPPDHEGDDTICNVAIVTSIAKEGELEWRPFLNLCVFRANDAKVWPRLAVPCVVDDGGIPHFNHRYSFPDEY